VPAPPEAARLEIRADRLDSPQGRAVEARFADDIAERYSGWDAGKGPSATPDELAPPDGRFLIAYLGEQAIGCATGDRQPEALTLFLALGYREIPDYNGNPYATYWMEKSIEATA
jgi:hypothetical protein